VSLDSRHGWQDLYLSLGTWPYRIAESYHHGNRERDELDFFLCFFVQCHAMRDWAIKSGALSKIDIDLLMESYDCMRLCRDIANRYKHLEISRPSVDANWSIWVDSNASDGPLCISARGKTWRVWDLMMECINFWEMAAAAYNLGENARVFRPM
jgi:hypothetical protein